MPTLIKAPPNRKRGVIVSERKNHPSSVPTIGWAKNVNEATAAGNSAKA